MQGILKYNKSQSIKEKIGKTNLIKKKKNNSFCSVKNTVKSKDKTRFIEKYVHITYLTKHFYPEYIENFQNMRKQIVHFLNE